MKAFLVCPDSEKPESSCGRGCGRMAERSRPLFVSSVRWAAFTLVELLAVIGVIAILCSLLLPSLSRSKESVRRTVCRNNIRQFCLGTQMYADDSNSYLLSGLDNNVKPDPEEVYSHTINLGDATMAAVTAYSGASNVVFCPGFAHGFIMSYAKKSGYSIGYNYLGGHRFSTTNYPGYVPWTSPQRSTDDPMLALVADPNHWDTTLGGWAIIPHASSGPYKRNGGSFILDGVRIWEAKAVGGNVGLLNGSVQWRPRNTMSNHIASSHQDRYVGAW